MIGGSASHFWELDLSLNKSRVWYYWDFVENRLHNIPPVVEDIPIVAMHTDLGPHNAIVSSQTCSEIRAIIDWEFVASTPSLHRIIKMLFRRPAPNRVGPEYDRADELREAFWGSIPY